jgi:hypothetical protein
MADRAASRLPAVGRDAAADGAPGPVPGTRATFGDVFAVGEYRALWLAQLLSVAGDQLARCPGAAAALDESASPWRVRRADVVLGSAWPGAVLRHLRGLRRVRCLPGRCQRRIRRCRPSRTPRPGIRLSQRGMQVLQGLWFVAAGAAATMISPASAIAISGGLGAAMAAALAIGWRRLSAPQSAHS